MIGFDRSTTELWCVFASTMFSMLLLDSTGAVADAETVRTGVVQISDGPIRGYKMYLYVFAPALNDDDDDGDDEGSVKRPVIVWIHGGGNFDSESNDYDARKLARDAGVVVVSLNHRPNVFGSLAHPALDSEGQAAANYGLMDQQFALGWVQRNIAAFGGDPRNVTIFGESVFQTL